MLPSPTDVVRSASSWLNCVVNAASSSGVDQNPGFARCHCVTDSTYIRCNSRYPEACGFKDHARKAFGITGQREYVGGAEERTHLV